MSVGRGAFLPGKSVVEFAFRLIGSLARFGSVQQ